MGANAGHGRGDAPDTVILQALVEPSGWLRRAPNAVASATAKDRSHPRGASNRLWRVSSVPRLCPCFTCRLDAPSQEEAGRPLSQVDTVAVKTEYKTDRGQGRPQLTPGLSRLPLSSSSSFSVRSPILLLSSRDARRALHFVRSRRCVVRARCVGPREPAQEPRRQRPPRLLGASRARPGRPGRVCVRHRRRPVQPSVRLYACLTGVDR